MAITTQAASTTEAAVQVSVEEYMERYAEHHYEWVKGVAIKMSPISLRHALLVDYLRDVLHAYFALNPIGRVLGEPFVMVLEKTDSRREPDIQVILNTNPGQLADTAMIGPADICIEVVSPESGSRDYGDKFIEYEQAGVREYWIIDPVRETCLFYRLQPTAHYAPVQPDEQGIYQTPLLPRLVIEVPVFWREKLPDVVAVVETVQAMVKA
jgi:Uma2 family endonuclease